MQSLCLSIGGLQNTLSHNLVQGAALSLDFTTGRATREGKIVSLDALLTCDRASPGAILKSGNLVEFGDNQLRRTSRGLLVEEQRTNYVANSALPASQTISLASGTYVLWIRGAGNATISGAASGVANEESHLDFTLATPGDVDIIFAGDVQFAQLEQGAFPTSPIVTTGAPVTRLMDNIQFVNTDWLDPQNCTLLVEWEQVAADTSVQNLIRWNNSSYHRVRSGNAALAQIKNEAGDLILNTGTNGFQPPAGIHRMAVALAPDDMAVAWSASLTGEAGIAVDTSGTPAAGANSIYLGSAGGGEVLNGWLRQITYWQSRISNAVIPTFCQ